MPIPIRYLILNIIITLTISEVAMTQTTIPWQSDNYEVRHFSRLDGMTHRNVIDLKRGVSGRLWVATQNGLNYYDGDVFRELKIISSDEPRSLFHVRLIEDPERNIWAIEKFSSDHRPILVEDSKGRIPQHPALGGQYDLPEDDSIRSFCRICFERSTQGKKVKALLVDIIGKEIEESKKWGFYNLFDTIFGSRPSNINTELDAVLRMTDGSYVYMYPGRGYLRISPDFSDIELYDKTTDNQSFKDFWSTAVPIDSKGNFWYPSHIENDSLVLKTFNTRAHLNQPAFHFFIDYNYNFWVISESEELLYYEPKSNFTYTFNFEFGKPNITLIDNENILWIGVENGLSRVVFPGKHFKTIGAKSFKSNEPAPISTSIRRIVQTKDSSFYTHENFGPIYKILDKEKMVTYLDKEPNGVTKLAVLNMVYHDFGSFEGLIIGTSNDIRIWDLTHDRYLNLPKSFSFGNVTTICYDSIQNAHLLVTGEMIYSWLDNNTLTMSPPTRLPKGVTNVLAIKNDQIFATSEESLILLDLENNTTTPCFAINTKLDIEGKNIRDIVIDKDVIWLASLEGLYGLDRVTYEPIHHFNKTSGLPGEIIYSLIQDKTDLWLGTDNGLSYLNIESLAIKSFFQWDGLSHNEFNTYATLIDLEGNIWMGGLNGINIFNPAKIKQLNFEPASLYLAAINVFNLEDKLSKTIPVNADSNLPTIQLKPSEKTIQVDISHHTLSRSNASRYLWYIEEIEPVWSNSSKEPIIAYRNLNPGTYKLHIRAEDFRGVVAANDLLLTIEVAQYWYYRSWAWAIWIFLGFTLAFFIVQFFFERKVEKERVAQLEVLDRQKNNLYTNITHEFRTPLTLILGYTDKINQMSTPLPSSVIKMATSIRRNGLQLLHLVNQMMDLARLESGELHINSKPVQLKPFLKHLVHSFDTIADIKAISLSFRCDEKLDAPYDFDAQKLQQILSNLISNAIKFSPKSSIVEVSASIKHDKDFNKNQLYITVKDNGPGIPTNEVKKVFDRFHRMENTMENNTPGSGIGLALAKELVLKMNGSIGVTPREKGGAKFYVYLPLIPSTIKSHDIGELDIPMVDEFSSFSALKITDELQKDSSLEKTGTDKPVILLVEDNIDVLDYIQSCLPGKYSKITAINGKEGLEKAREYVPDLIISDVMMPVMNGFTLCTRLKTDRITSHIPVMLLTARSDEQSRIEGLRYGADAYLSKPFNEKELLLRIENMYQLIRAMKEKYTRLDILSSLPPSSPSAEDMFMDEVKAVLKVNFSDETFNTDDFASALKMSKSQLYRKIKALTDDTPANIIRRYRLEAAKKLLANQPNLTVSEVAYACGFSNPKYFSNLFLKAFNIRPGQINQS